jgi:hypothetical protein
MERYYDRVSVATGDEAASILAAACIARSFMESTPDQAKQFPSKYAEGEVVASLNDENQLLMYNIFLTTQIKQLQQSSNPLAPVLSTGYIYWLMVFRALAVNEFFPLGRRIMAELSRGFADWESVLNEVTNGNMAPSKVDECSPVRHYLVVKE